jgi:hypothetical protein
MRVKVVSDDVGVGENGAKAWTNQEYSLAQRKVKLQSKHLWVGGSCWGKRMELELANKAWVHKKKLLLQVFLVAC